MQHRFVGWEVRTAAGGAPDETVGVLTLDRPERHEALLAKRPAHWQR